MNGHNGRCSRIFEHGRLGVGHLAPAEQFDLCVGAAECDAGPCGSRGNWPSDLGKHKRGLLTLQGNRVKDYVTNR